MGTIDPKEKIRRISVADRLWAELRDSKPTLCRLLTESVSDISTIGLVFKCLVAVINELDLYKDEIEDIDEKTNELIKDVSAAGQILRIAKEASLLRSICDDKKSVNDRQEDLQKLKKSLWGSLYQKQDHLLLILETFPILTIDQIKLLYECIEVVTLELEIKEMSIHIIASDY